MNRTSIIGELSTIWCRVFKLPSIGADENFFELGGTPELAAQMFREVARAFGREIPPVMIYEASTINGLTDLLENSRSNSCPPLFTVRTGSIPAIFLAHGMGGDALQLHRVAEELNMSHAIFATQAPGLDTSAQPLQSVEQLAEVYLRAMKAVQPHGPYILIGYSFGGLVMLEVARSLTAEGQHVALLAMLDTYPHRTHLRPAQQFPLLVKLSGRRLSAFVRGFRNKPAALDSNSALNLASKRIHASEFIAWRSYRPQPYAGKIYFLRATVPTFYPKDARSVWTPFVREFEMRDIPGDHTDLINTHHKLVADLLVQQLKEVLDCKCVA